MKNPKKEAAPKAPVRARAHADGYETEAYTPLAAASAVKGPPKPRIPDTPLFMFQHRPGMYQLMQGEVVPRLTKLKIGAAGVNGVGQDSKGNPDPRPAIAQALEDGNTIIPFDVDGPGTSYIRVPKGMPNVHLSRWEKPFPGSHLVEVAEAEFVAWLKSLVSRGIIPACPLHVLHTLLANKHREWDAMIERPNYTHSTAYERLKADIQVLEHEIEQNGGGEAAETEIPAPPVEPSDESGVDTDGNGDSGEES